MTNINDIGKPARTEAEIFSIVSFTIALFLNSGFTDYWIHRTHVKRESKQAAALSTS